MKSIIGKERIKSELPEILYDESRFVSGIPSKIFFPENRSDLISVISDAHAEQSTITMLGAQTGITGGSVPVDNCIALSFKNMRAIKGLSKKKNTYILECEPGVTLEQINSYLAINPVSSNPRHLFYPPDPTELSAQLGGTIATNASGARSYKFGSTRNHIEWLDLIFSDGDSLRLTRGDYFEKNGSIIFTTENNVKKTIPMHSYSPIKVKNASGYYSHSGMDLIDLFIGSEGTLAIIAGAGIRLIEYPSFLAGLSFLPSRNDAFKFADFLRTQKQVSAIEFFDQSAITFVNSRRTSHQINIPLFPPKLSNAIYWELIENNDVTFDSQVPIFENALSQCNSSFESTWSGFDVNEMATLKSFRHLIPELINAHISYLKQSNPSLRKLGTDSALPPSCFSKIFEQSIDLIESKQIDYIAFGHLGDYHLHINLLPKTTDELNSALAIYKSLMEISIKNSGTVSAEHGIGKVKRGYLKQMYGDKLFLQMLAIKKELDPSGVLNPENLF